MAAPLYKRWDLYADVFPIDDECIHFFDHFLPEKGLILDAGCGGGHLTVALNRVERLLVGFDLEPPPTGLPGNYVRGDLRRLPFREASFSGLICRLFGISYAMAASDTSPLAVAKEVARVTRPGAVLLIEAPIAWNPRRLQGIEEATRIGPNSEYRFRYLDEERVTPFGSVIHTLITFQQGRDTFEIAAPLHVYTPQGARDWLAAAGARLSIFHPAYSIEEAATEPPIDCLRGIIRAERLPISIK